MNCELPDVQAGFRKGRGARDQIDNIHWIIEKAKEFQKSIYFCFIDYAKAFDCVDHEKLENSSRDGNSRPADLPPEKPVCRSGNTSQPGSDTAMSPEGGTATELGLVVRPGPGTSSEGGLGTRPALSTPLGTCQCTSSGQVSPGLPALHGPAP